MTTVAVPAPNTRELITTTLIAPSILSADYARLGDHVVEVLDAGARVIHFDVMDGHFVPPITFGTIVVAALAERVHDAGAIADVHLMIERPERHVEAFAKAGADVITVHCEATANLHYVLGAIREAGCMAGAAINPGTPCNHLAAVAEMLDVALCMTVNPGWGAQRFIDATRAKIERVREIVPERCAVEVDGGVDVNTAPQCVERGANLLVAGSAIFARPSPGDAFLELNRGLRASRDGHT
jgi:ribulose-phosphate 3-epimerase